ncbi:hornerin-like [Aethina tumida]|uniref:hornerin-like n=1 Tax=Aethina tumida TaxID=116153 RepID=UPI00096B04C3|nr:hornerin-like [Aethina tumida]
MFLRLLCLVALLGFIHANPDPKHHHHWRGKRGILGAGGFGQQAGVAGQFGIRGHESHSASEKHSEQHSSSSSSSSTHSSDFAIGQAGAAFGQGGAAFGHGLRLVRSPYPVLYRARRDLLGAGGLGQHFGAVGQYGVQGHESHSASQKHAEQHSSSSSSSSSHSSDFAFGQGAAAFGHAGASLGQGFGHGLRLVRSPYPVPSRYCPICPY